MIIMNRKKKRDGRENYFILLKEKWSKLRKSEFIESSVFNPWKSYNDEINRHRIDRKKLVKKPFWSLNIKEGEIEKSNNKIKKTIFRRKKKQKKIKWLTNI